ncbi:MAG: TlpA disulfide reductase family protein [Planctomycetota bacterium]
MNRRKRAGLLATTFTFAVLAGQAAAGEGKFMEAGITAKTGGYRPARAKLDQDADIVKKAPEDLQNPTYGTMQVGDVEVTVIIDRPEDEDPKIFVDSNRDQDLTNDPAPKWRGNKRGKYTMFTGQAKVSLGPDREGVVKFYQFDPQDPSRASLKDTLLYYPDFGYEFPYELDGEKFSAYFAGSLEGDEPLRIDRDKNGRISRTYELAKPGEPFNFTGTTYVFEWKDNRLDLREAEEAMEMLPLPPVFELGKQSIAFTADTMEGNTIRFPQDYAGKIVMLDFWATFCKPCIGEIPHMKEAFDDHHADGFEILGISLDREDKESSIETFMEARGIVWPQIYDGGGWGAKLAVRHDVTSIPFVLLIDGDDGKIIGTIDELRGPKLTKFIGKQLVKKGLKSPDEEPVQADEDTDAESDSDSSDLSR